MKTPVFLLALGLIVGASGAQGSSTFKTLYEFCSVDAPQCSDGLTPSALVQDAAGNLYGTAQMGGDPYAGLVFEIAADGSYHVLENFCSQCKKGIYPQSRLVIDTLGNLYGTAAQGGAHEGGTVFKLSPDADHKKWKFSVLYAFCAKANCADGAYPYAGLTYQGVQTGAAYDGTSPLYGTAGSGGANGEGMVFVLTPGNKHKFKEKVLYDFCPQANCPDGAEPHTLPVLDAMGNLYGVTDIGGGPSSPGVVYELQQRGHRYVETVLHTFCQEAECIDGSAPSATPVFGPDGRLYGPAISGGTLEYGALYAITPNGTKSKYEVLYNFCSAENCLDGKFPWGGVAFDAAGDIVGTAYAGGSTDGGLIFKLHRRKETVLHEFCSGCDDGYGPVGDLLQNSAGNFFGVTQVRGANGIGGTAFELMP